MYEYLIKKEESCRFWKYWNIDCKVFWGGGNTKNRRFIMIAAIVVRSIYDIALLWSRVLLSLESHFLVISLQFTGLMSLSFCRNMPHWGENGTFNIKSCGWNCSLLQFLGIKTLILESNGKPCMMFFFFSFSIHFVHYCCEKYRVTSESSKLSLYPGKRSQRR